MDPFTHCPRCELRIELDTPVGARCPGCDVNMDAYEEDALETGAGSLWAPYGIGDMADAAKNASKVLEADADDTPF